MKPLPHRYEVRLSGGPGGYAALSTPGVPELRSAPPLDYDGPGDAWSPEHLLLAAVETCFLLTLRAVAKASKITFTALDLSSEGTVDRQDGITRSRRSSCGRGSPSRRARTVSVRSGCWTRASAPVWSRPRFRRKSGWSPRL